jgi:5'-nucleotidase
VIPPKGLRAGAITLAAAFVLGCGGRGVHPLAPVPASAPAPAPASRVHVTLLHFNDVYEITAMAGGTRGGPARVATLRRDLLARNPNTVTLLAGDFLSPSALSTARLDGERLEGRQMVAVLNSIGVDYATFGNHEFDLREAAFSDRLREAGFGVLSVNVGSRDGRPLPGVRPHVILRYDDGRGGTLRVAVFGVTMDRDQSAYAPIAEPLGPAAAQARLLRDSADVVVALTHLPLAQDIALAEAVPGIDLVLGGHEHENLLIRRGPDLTPIAKADANFRTVFVHDLTWDPESRRLDVSSRLLAITDSIREEPATRDVAARWVETAYRGFRDAGFQPESTVARLPIEMDGRESTVYRDTSALTSVIADAMLAEVAGADGVLYNAGSIRLDDVLASGSISQYDIIRILPFGGPVVEVEMTGGLLRRVLEQGERNRGTGGFLQRARIERTDGGWTVGGAPLADARRYRLAVSEFLISGREQGFDFLSRENPELAVSRPHRDIRFALIDLLRARYGLD